MDAVFVVDNNCNSEVLVATNRPMIRSTAIKYADKWFSLYIREKGGYQCFTCGAKMEHGDHVMQCGHLFSRVAFSTRWDEDNAECQCSGCNMYHEHNPHRFVLNYIQKYGQDKYERVFVKHSKPFKITTAEIYLLGDEYRRKLSELKEAKGGRTDKTV